MAPNHPFQISPRPPTDTRVLLEIHHRRAISRRRLCRALPRLYQDGGSELPDRVVTLLGEDEEGIWYSMSGHGSRLRLKCSAP